MDDVVIRASRLDDMPAVADLRWRWSVDEDGRSPVQTPEEYRRSMTDFAARHRESHRCVVAERDGVVLGMAWLAVHPRPPAPHVDGDRFAAELQTVYVHPELRGSGVAGRLVTALLELADELGVERTSVHSSVDGERLYRRLGFGDARLLLQRPPED
ncbi:GNAT family N-acetyltransferase [Curtobacterium flaccumfaciens pv. flaccumfaciens]|uniref:GNAT family N-acetyltransferase n=1 Tax=Curtobacterium flaccumfaciens TaxID=2035 RepID=UPI001AD98D91|nr:GNAT family N-acetyltransferase [Curtobacterium flaccumfaciens]MBO9048512.1 GNAT family N-acetyltransferase [Curtobacterium flaccumfaciens pv. flaccumfaciens]MBO9056309.1 GNAT family N-acetyltransferase [Curtobacterium flaccumfaciens pv. flaccumfaciens]QTR89369.1 GNAT family N-acetyltransferase [Curtobacterium flaccumfaciens pv. flaccumfaciens]QVG64636.1 GNAT family N-acetyltransferase [Curtobacterium flaccumfaciens pv. flaccumfaciens]